MSEWVSIKTKASWWWGSFWNTMDTVECEDRGALTNVGQTSDYIRSMLRTHNKHDTVV